jgi:hypothetical protein
MSSPYYIEQLPLSGEFGVWHRKECRLIDRFPTLKKAIEECEFWLCKNPEVR